MYRISRGKASTRNWTTSVTDTTNTGRSPSSTTGMWRKPPTLIMWGPGPTRRPPPHRLPAPDALGIGRHHVAERQGGRVPAAVDDAEQDVALGEDPRERARRGPVL